MRVYYLGCAPYGPLWDLQERLRLQVEGGAPPVLLLCEHFPVITLGKGATEKELLFPKEFLQKQGIEVYPTDRGGQATYHGPGQLVCYPIVPLSEAHRRRRGGTVLGHVTALGEAAVSLAESLGVRAKFWRDPVGTFVENRKLAAIGVRIKRRVTMHGLALNVTGAPTAVFRQGLFVPCGVPLGQVTSLEEETGRDDLDPASLAEPFARAFCQGAEWPFTPLRYVGLDSFE